MASIARSKRLVGSIQRTGPGTIVTIASATQIAFPENASRAYISGSTTIATIQTDKVRPGRQITLIWAPSATAAVTDTAVGSTNLAPNTTTANVCLSGSISPAAGTTLSLIQDNYGQWLETARSVNG